MHLGGQSREAVSTQTLLVARSGTGRPGQCTRVVSRAKWYRATQAVGRTKRYRQTWPMHLCGRSRETVSPHKLLVAQSGIDRPGRCIYVVGRAKGYRPHAIGRTMQYRQLAVVGD